MASADIQSTLAKFRPLEARLRGALQSSEKWSLEGAAVKKALHSLISSSMRFMPEERLIIGERGTFGMLMRVLALEGDAGFDRQLLRDSLASWDGNDRLDREEGPQSEKGKGRDSKGKRKESAPQSASDYSKDKESTPVQPNMPPRKKARLETGGDTSKEGIAGGESLGPKRWAKGQISGPKDQATAFFDALIALQGQIATSNENSSRCVLLLGKLHQEFTEFKGYVTAALDTQGTRLGDMLNEQWMDQCTSYLQEDLSENRTLEWQTPYQARPCPPKPSGNPPPAVAAAAASTLDRPKSPTPRPSPLQPTQPLGELTAQDIPRQDVRPENAIDLPNPTPAVEPVPQIPMSTDITPSIKLLPPTPSQQHISAVSTVPAASKHDCNNMQTLDPSGGLSPLTDRSTSPRRSPRTPSPALLPEGRTTRTRARTQAPAPPKNTTDATNARRKR